MIGVINITEKESDDHFNEDELQLLDFLSSQIALNYRRVQLYEKFKAMLKESQTLKDELGKSSKEATHLKRQVVQHERLASIGKLAGGIAHEFNNPLDGVMRYTNLCLEQANEDEVVRGYLLEIKHGLNRMANIVKSLLACSRSADVALHKTNPNTSLEQSLQALQAVVMHKGVKIVKDLGKDLPEIDDMGLERIFTNLIHNAIDAVPTGGWIKVSTFREDDHLGISVSDNGCGIEENRIQQIFEPFHTTKDIDKGCGLGLTIVSEIVKSYDGHIRVESSPGAGTTFTVMVPIKESYV